MRTGRSEPAADTQPQPYGGGQGQRQQQGVEQRAGRQVEGRVLRCLAAEALDGAAATLQRIQVQPGTGIDHRRELVGRTARTVLHFAGQRILGIDHRLGGNRLHFGFVVAKLFQIAEGNLLERMAAGANIGINRIAALQLLPGRKLRFAVALDDAQPVIVDTLPDSSEQSWQQAVLDGSRTLKTPLHIKQSGVHRLRIYLLDPAVVLHKLLLDTGGLQPSYLGPPQSPYLTNGAPAINGVQ